MSHLIIPQVSSLECQLVASYGFRKIKYHVLYSTASLVLELSLLGNSIFLLLNTFQVSQTLYSRKVQSDYVDKKNDSLNQICQKLNFKSEIRFFLKFPAFNSIKKKWSQKSKSNQIHLTQINFTSRKLVFDCQNFFHLIRKLSNRHIQ